MAESTLSAAFEEIRIELADFLGLGRNSSNWSSDDTNRLASYMKAGLSQFYFPPKFDDKDPHKWSFLEPVATLTITASDNDYDLPENFGTMKSRVLTFDSNTLGPPIKLIGEGELRKMQQGNTNTGQPRWAAVRPKASFTGSTGQRWELLLYPTPDASYTAYYRYKLLANALTTGLYAYGGAAHTQTIIQSCIAIAELRMDGVKGNQYDQFLTLLTASIEHDIQLSRTHDFGYNGDNVPESYQRHESDTYEVTVWDSDSESYLS